MEPKRDMDERLNIDGDPGEAVTAPLSMSGPDLDQHGIPDEDAE